MQFREAIDRDAEDLHALAARISLARNLVPDLASTPDLHDQERQLEHAAFELRRRWLGVAHGPADRTFKSPQEGDIAHVPCGQDVRFGYERALGAAVLEERGETYLRVPEGWSGEVVLFRSGQAALSCLLHFAAARWGRDGTLALAHAGAYFETAALLQSYPSRVFDQVLEPATAIDITLAEPVWCDGRFGCSGSVPTPQRMLLLDTTLVGPDFDLDDYFSLCPLLVAYSSGLKLDQAGLELANVGIVRIFAHSDGPPAQDIASALRQLRSLMGNGLTLDELSALSAPWFMDRLYGARYTEAVFANNRALAQAIGRSSAVFGDHCHPSLEIADATAPFCALELRQPSIGNYRRLREIIEREIERRCLLASRGGSFGFRGHRFELIEPEPGQGRPFLRIAMGWRDGHSRHGLCELFGELAAQPSFEALDRAYGR